MIKNKAALVCFAFIIALVFGYNATNLHEYIIDLEMERMSLEEKCSVLQVQYDELESKYEQLQAQEPKIVKEVQVMESLGEFKITHYCNCSICCGPYGETTYTGTIPQVNHTIGVDPDTIPLGSKVVIEGIEYTAEDIGGAVNGNVIDIYVSSHEEAIQRGVKYVEVYKEVE